jgi:DNA processing protein
MSSHASALFDLAMSPWREMGAYEALWSKQGSSFKKIAELFRDQPEARPSTFVDEGVAESFSMRVMEILAKGKINEFGIRLRGTRDYPTKLRHADHPIEMLYYQGWWDLACSRSVAIVGTRNPSDEGRMRARKIAKSLVEGGFTIVSGLAQGIDTVAHETAIREGGLTIGVIGTPLSQSYPATNRVLQAQIAKDYLLISQVPVVRSSEQGPRVNRMFFPERNITMSALTEATIIIEAGETSGTLIQARAALKQGRKLFILDSCFENHNLTWPARFESQGAIRVKTYEDITRNLIRNAKSESDEGRQTHSPDTGTLAFG